MILRDLATFVRSKTAGPFMVTFDIVFSSTEKLDRAWHSGAFTKDQIAPLFPGTNVADVKIFYVPAAVAIKVSLPRRIFSGAVGDTDVLAGQQFAPLLELEIGEGV